MSWVDPISMPPLPRCHLCAADWNHEPAPPASDLL